MKRITKYSKKIKLRYIKSAGIICGLMVLAFPWFSNLSETEEGYYSVTVNGTEIGVVGSEDIVEDAYINARLKIENENESSVYIDYDLTLEAEDNMYGEKLSGEELSDKMYDVLKESSVEVKQKAYIVDVDGFTVTLSSKEDVLALLNAAKSKYDTEGSFVPTLTDDTDSKFSQISYEMVNLNTETKTNNLVMASAAGTQTEDTVAEEEIDKIENISFLENIDIVETYVSSSQVVPVEDAIEMVTKEKEENKVYVVVAGDTLSGIASQFDLTLDGLLKLNPDYDLETYIQIGDRITVTVPEPEISVVVKKQETYEEDYDMPIEYVYNDNKYTTYSSVVSEGESGYRKVTADVKYVNGIEQSRKIIEEKVIDQAVAKVVEVGTLTPPTFIKPVTAGSLSSTFGARWGTFHYGVDWSCSIGTSVMASCSGTVESAGWSGGYGYCITINHGNGIKTRYAHLSGIYVSYGEYVNQGEVIGLSGNTGDSTGPHLHFEIIEGGVKKNPLNYVN